MERKLRTVANMAATSGGAFSEKSLRWLIFNAESNGLKAAGVILRVGRRVLLDVDAFHAWLDAINGRADQATKLRPLATVPTVLGKRDRAS